MLTTLLDLTRSAARELKARVGPVDSDRALIVAMSGLIEAAATRYAVDPGAQWAPGEPLKLLFAGYSGSRNTGADVRVEEMVRQFRHLFGDDHLDLSILTNDPALTRGYFRTVKQLELPKIFPKFLFDTVHEQHGVVACEGSMFKSKFANALSTMMAGSLGLALAEGKLAVAYGGEAGAMDPPLEDLVARYCKGARIIARNEASVRVLGRLGIPADVGTDTAWTFEPAPPDVGAEVLRKAGWDGVRPVLVVCPINAFWWPVKPDVVKGAANALFGAHANEHYASVYFHAGGPEVAAKQDRYVEALATAVRAYRRRHDVFVACVAMEQLDRSACEDLRDRLGEGVGVVASDEWDMFAMVSAIRHADLMVSSRYHALVTSMPAGVVSVGVTMDERIVNLMADRGQPELCLTVDQPDLAERLLDAMNRADQDRARVRSGIEQSVARSLATMGEMGARLVRIVRDRHPEFPFRPGLGDLRDPWIHLPPLSPALADLVRRHRSAA